MKAYDQDFTYWKVVWNQFKKNKIGLAALWVFFVFTFVGLYAPFFASSRPLLAVWDGKIFFPLFRYLFYPGFFTKPIDLFFNVLMFTCPLGIACMLFLKGRTLKLCLGGLVVLHLAFFIAILMGIIKNPESDPFLQQARHRFLQNQTPYREDPLLGVIPTSSDWSFDLNFMTPYEKLKRLLRYKQRQAQHALFAAYNAQFQERTGREMPTLWAVDQRNELEKRLRLQKIIDESKADYQAALDKLPQLMANYLPFSHALLMAKYDLEHLTDEAKLEAEKNYLTLIETSNPFRLPLLQARNIIEKYRKTAAELNYLDEHKAWLATESAKLSWLVFPFLRSFHWEDDAGGAQMINKHVPWQELTRVNRKDLTASLIFGIRVSLVVGIASVALCLIIGIPLGTVAGYFAGKMDLVISRLIEIWEAMPTFFVLLLVVAITQTKSIFLVIGVLGLFGWTAIGRFMRSEVLKQKNLPYVLACKSLGYSHFRIMFSHILPNAIPPVLTLLPFAMMAAIASEAGLSFLGLGEEGSASLGVLMDEGRSVFPAESYLLWPPAILLTGLLISIALIGDSLRDAIDPKMR